MILEWYMSCTCFPDSSSLWDSHKRVSNDSSDVMEWTDLIYLLNVVLPTNSWLLSCRWMCPSAGAFWTAPGWWSTYSEASFTFLSALTWCQRSSFRADAVSTFTSRGPFPTSNEKSTWVGAGNTNTFDGCSDWYLADVRIQLIRRNCWREMRNEMHCSEICCVADDVWWFEKDARRTSKTTSNDDEMNDKTSDRYIQLPLTGEEHHADEHHHL